MPRSSAIRARCPLGHPGQVPAHVADADDAEHLVGHPDAAPRRQDRNRRQHVFRHAPRVRALGAGKADAALGQVRLVDVVEADGCGGDKADGARVEQVAPDARHASDEQGVGIGDALGGDPVGPKRGDLAKRAEGLCQQRDIGVGDNLHAAT